MEGPVVLVGVLLLFASLLFSALNIVLRDMSCARLEEQLGRRGRDDMIDVLCDRRDALVLATSTGRVVANLAVAFVVLAVLIGAGWQPGWQLYLAGFGIAAGFVFVFGVVLPHFWAEYTRESILASLASELLVLGAVFSPLIGVQKLLERMGDKLTGAVAEPDEAISEIEQEILDAVSEGEAQGHMAQDEKDMIVSVIEAARPARRRDHDAAH